jgi:Icc-related predicted phosphoesterase
MRILFLTDLHGAQDYVVPLLEKAGEADLLVVGGDITSFGGPREAQAVLEPLRCRFPRVLCLPGNVDRPELLPWLEAEGLSIHGRGVVIEGVGFAGCGGSNPTPLGTPLELPEEALAALLEEGYAAIQEAPVRVVVSHVPPRDTRTDQVFFGKHVGSTAVRAFLEREKPTLCLCGHIHESAAIDRLGPVWVVNPGPFSCGSFARVKVGDEVSCELARLSAPAPTRARAFLGGLGTRALGCVRHLGTK